MENKLYNVVGIDDLEGVTFARCTTEAKAIKAMELLEANGFEDMVTVIQDHTSVDTIEIEGEIIEL